MESTASSCSPSVPGGKLSAKALCPPLSHAARRDGLNGICICRLGTGSFSRVPSDAFSTSREPGTPGRTETSTPQGIFSARCGCAGLSVSGCTGRYSSRPLTAPGTWVQPGVSALSSCLVSGTDVTPLLPRHRHPPVPALCPGLLWSLCPALVASVSSSAATVPRLPLTLLSPTPWAALPPTRARVLGSSQPHAVP